MEDYKIIDNSSIHSYRTELPNILMDLDLDMYEGWLYVHLKRIAGANGTSYASNKTLAEKTKMSLSKLKITKKSLEKKGLIKIHQRKKKNGSNDTTLIEITDLWRMNFSSFQKNIIGVTTKPGVGHHKTEVGHQVATKKEPYKNKEKQQLSFKNIDIDQTLKKVKKRWLQKGRSTALFEQACKLYKKRSMEKYIKYPEKWMDAVYNDLIKEKKIKDKIKKMVNARKEFCKTRRNWTVKNNIVSMISGAIEYKYKLDGDEEFWKKHHMGRDQL